MKKIFVLVGRTGAGKSTLCKKLVEHFNYPLQSFASMGKKFANENGYNRIRECHLAMELSEFKTKMTEFILNIITEQLNTCDNIIIDGLYIDDVVNILKEKYICKLMYLKTSDEIRYERIAQKLSITIEQAKEENKIKERLKNEVGINELIENADIIIDGNLEEDVVFEVIKQYLEQQ